MLFLQNENKGYFVDVFLLAKFGVPLHQNVLSVFNSDNLQSLGQVRNRNRLDTKDVVRIEDGLKVLLI